MLNKLYDFLYLIVDRQCIIYDTPVLNIPLKSNILFRTFFMNLSLILFSLTHRYKQGHKMNLCIVNVLNVELFNYTNRR